MKRAYMVYHPAEAKKNQQFLRLFQEAGIKQQICFSYCPAQDCQNPETPLPDLVLNRTRDPRVSAWYQERGVPVLHTPWLTESANDKYKMLTYFQSHLPASVRCRKWCPDTVFLAASEEKSQETLTQKVQCGTAVIGQPVQPDLRSGVMKSVDGHGGSEVFLAEDAAGWKEKLRKRDCVWQERIRCERKDIRVYILGRTVYCAMQREGKGDFRSNFSLGGQVQEIALTEQQMRYVQAFLDCLPPSCQGMFGLDFLPLPDGTLLFNELEEMAGCRMLYQYTNHEIVEDYVAWIARIFWGGAV